MSAKNWQQISKRACELACCGSGDLPVVDVTGTMML